MVDAFVYSNIFLWNCFRGKACKGNKFPGRKFPAGIIRIKTGA